MNPVSCCNSCASTSAEEIFPMGAYQPYRVGYGHTFSAYPSASRPTGITPVGMAGPCAGESVARPCNWETATLGAYDRGDGNPKPYYPLPRIQNMGSYYGETGNPTQFRPMDAYATTGNPTLFQPLSAYARTGNPTEFRPMSENGYATPMNIGEGGMKPMGVFPLIGWGVIAGLGALGILGATYVADTAVDNVTTDPNIATAVGQPVVQASTNLLNTALIVGGIYFLFRKDIQKALR